MTKDFDVVVIGGGPAGICGANTAGIFGKRVALVEKLHEVAARFRNQPRADFAAVILTDSSWNLDYECAGD
jgi:2-polyprenyl-6-methoxyphenol hydroxylase-like FAD-dependent oxidoreductase